ncbi:MAG: putative antitoxin VapB45 [Nitrospira sp.]|nr:MAG: putative antitoxin VapB45 [Nitrospira sp.]
MPRRSSAFTRATDIRELPSYGFAEAAQYLRIPRTTIRDWVTGRYYGGPASRRFSKPIIALADPSARSLSFMNLVEIHVLDAIRREYNIPLEKVRKAVAYLSKQFPSKHPLADREFETDGLDLFIQKFGQLINISQAGQLAMKEVLQTHLQRIERDLSGIPVRLYPFTRKRESREEPRAVVIDPHVSFGRPVLSGTGIPTAVIAERYKAGESMDALADDYGRQRFEIEEAIRCELALDAA